MRSPPQAWQDRAGGWLEVVMPEKEGSNRSGEGDTCECEAGMDDEQSSAEFLVLGDEYDSEY